MRTVTRVVIGESPVATGSTRCRTIIAGVPCWVDTSQRRSRGCRRLATATVLRAGCSRTSMPPESEGQYVHAPGSGGGDVAAVGCDSPSAGARPRRCGEHLRLGRERRRDARRRSRDASAAASLIGADSTSWTPARMAPCVTDARGGGVLRLAGEARTSGARIVNEPRQPEFQRPEHPRRRGCPSPSTARVFRLADARAAGWLRQMWTLPGLRGLPGAATTAERSRADGRGGAPRRRSSRTSVASARCRDRRTTRAGRFSPTLGHVTTFAGRRR